MDYFEVLPIPQLIYNMYYYLVVTLKILSITGEKFTRYQLMTNLAHLYQLNIKLCVHHESNCN